MYWRWHSQITYFHIYNVILYSYSIFFLMGLVIYMVVISAALLLTWSWWKQSASQCHLLANEHGVSLLKLMQNARSF